MATSDCTVARPSVRLALREATRRVHERLHRLPLFEELQAGTITRRDYARLLQRLYGFHKPVEDVLLARRAPAGMAADWKRLARVHRLEADLRYLGVEPQGLPCMAPLPIRSTDELLGTLYVREGATLGGRMLARTLDGLLGYDRRGRTFFAGDAGDVACWQAICAALEAHADEIDAMITAACATFTAFETWFETWEDSATGASTR